MHNRAPRTPRYRFGPFELDPTEGTLSRNSIRVKLQDLPYRLLLMLVERPREIVTREELRQCLWPENTFVEFDNSLGVAIRKVRDSLGRRRRDAEIHRDHPPSRLSFSGASHHSLLCADRTRRHSHRSRRPGGRPKILRGIAGLKKSGGRKTNRGRNRGRPRQTLHRRRQATAAKS